MPLYRPTPFQVKDASLVRKFIREHPFATVICRYPDDMTVSHLPILLGSGDASEITLVGHVAARNPQAEDFRAGREVLVIFQGPHAYISPLWYENPAEVPTMSYIAVHVYGTAREIVDRTRIMQYFQKLNDYYEADRSPRWSLDFLSEEFNDRMLREIVVFEIRVTHVEEKFKLSQNRKPADRANVRKTLAASSDLFENTVADWMKRLGIGD